MQDLGKVLFVVGIVVALAGAWLWSGRGTGWLGRLPGDISYQKGDLHVYFTVATCILVSTVLSLAALNPGKSKKLLSCNKFPLKAQRWPAE